MKIADNIIELIGKTPLVRLNRLTKGLDVNIFVKLESKNPGGSVKDRLAYAMISSAERQGLIHSDSVIIEPTSGNTGIGLAMICAVKGYRLIIVMPESVSEERRILLKAYGAELILTSAKGGMKEAIAKAEELASIEKQSFIPMQFENPSNPEIHRQTTALEIWDDTDGNVDIFVAGSGTGGTITGVSEVLKQKNNKIRCYVVEPENSPVLSGGEAGSHKIQGIGPGFIPKILNTTVYDEVIRVPDQLAFETARLLASQEGILCGISSGANVAAALKLAERKENKGKNMIVIICDTGERYLSTNLYSERKDAI